MTDRTPQARTADAVEEIQANTPDLTRAEDATRATESAAASLERMAGRVPSVAAEEAAAAGQREAAVLQAGGVRDARVLQQAGQRRINAVWEITQAAIALIVVITTSIAIFAGRVFDSSIGALPPEWWTILGLVIGFYFGRTNHARTGDVPDLPQHVPGVRL